MKDTLKNVKNSQRLLDYLISITSCPLNPGSSLLCSNEDSDFSHLLHVAQVPEEMEISFTPKLAHI
jgi:hypothetical protein